MGQRFKNPLINFAKNNHDASGGDFDGYAVTTSDSVDLPNGPCQALYVTAAGNVNVQLQGGGTAVLTSLTAGQIVAVGASRVLTTSTTATGVFALYQ
jgi:hypothetical protein